MIAVMKRIVAGFLWFFAIWYLGAVVASVVNVPDVVGPIVGLAAGVLVAVDPRHIIWTPRRPDMETVEA
jgi:hypothetical protein